MTGTTVSVDAALAAVFREEAGRLTGALTRALGNFDVAEESVQDALLTALEGWQPSPQADDRLRLIFTCCHPALSRQAQLALTLRAVCGFTTAQIAHALVASEAAIAQRLARARRKIVTAAIPYRIPGDDELDERLAQVLAVLYLLFNEGYLASGGRQPARRDLAEDAAWLAAQLATLYPRQPEALGLLALMRLHLARADARLRRARRAGPALPPGPQPLGPGGDRRGGRHPGARGQARAARPLPAAGGDRRLPHRGRDLGGRPTGPRSWPCTFCSWP